MKQYHELLRHVLENGVVKSDRTGVGTISVFGYENRYNLQDGFPLLTTKKMHTKSIIHELLWFLKGDTNIKYLQDNGVKIWDEWADKWGNLGPVYGHQWRKFGSDSHPPYYAGVDQISNLINDIKKNPFSRRLIISAWNPVDLPLMKLPPCHLLYQFNVRPDKDGKPEYLDCKMYQRSADSFLGVPFNIASYALLTMMVAHVTGLKPGHFIHSFGDLHIYSNHIEQVKLQLTRAPKKLPTMKIVRNVESIFDFKFEDFVLEGYDPHPHIKAPVAV